MMRSSVILRRLGLAASLLLGAAALLLPATASAQSGSYDWKLIGSNNTTQGPSGLVIILRGSGSLSTTANTISGGGSYTIVDASGTVVGSGTWTAESLTSFTPWGPGGSTAGTSEGGNLKLTADFTGTGSGALNGPEPVEIQCSMWRYPMSPPGFPWPPDFATTGSYTNPLTGGVMFNTI